MSGGFRVGHMEVVAATALGERQDKLGWREFLGLRKMREREAAKLNSKEEKVI